MTARDEWRWTDERGVQRLVRTDELRAALASKLLAPSTLVWRPGMSEWMPAAMLPELAAAARGAAGGAAKTTAPLEEMSSVTSVMAEALLGAPAAPADQAPPPADQNRKIRTLVGMTVPASLLAESARQNGPNVPIVVPAAGSAKNAGRRGFSATQPPSYGPADSPSDSRPEASHVPRAPITERGPVGSGGIGGGAYSSMPGDRKAPAIWPSDVDGDGGVDDDAKDDAETFVADKPDPTGPSTLPSEGRNKDVATLRPAAGASMPMPMPLPLPPLLPTLAPPPMAAPAPLPPTPALVPLPPTPALAPLPPTPAPAPLPSTPAPAPSAVADSLGGFPALIPRKEAPRVPSTPIPPRPGQTTTRSISSILAGSSPSPLKSGDAASRKPSGNEVSKVGIPAAGVAAAVPTSGQADGVSTGSSSAAAGQKFVPPPPANVRSGARATFTASSPSAPKPHAIPPAPPLAAAPTPAPAVTAAPTPAPVVTAAPTPAPAVTAAPTPAPPVAEPPARVQLAADLAPATDKDLEAAQLSTVGEDGGPSRLTLTKPFPSFSGQSHPDEPNPADLSFDDPPAKLAPAAARLDAALSDPITSSLPNMSAPISLPLPPLAAPSARPSRPRFEPAREASAPSPFSPSGSGDARPELDADPASPDAPVGGHPLRLPVQVPVFSLVGAGAALIFMALTSFVVGRCSAPGRPAEGRREAVRSPMHMVPYISRSAIPEPPKPCWVVRQPVMWAPRVSKSIPFDVFPTASGSFAVGYARSETSAIGLEVDPMSGKIDELFSKETEDAIDRVTPAPGSAFVITTETQGGSMRPLLQVPGEPPFVVGVGGGSVAIASDPGATSSALWPLQGDGDASAVRVQSASSSGHAVLFRRGSAIWGGFLGPDRKPIGALTQVVGSGGSVGKPMSGWNGRELAVVFADRPKDSERYEIRVGRAPSGSIPSSTDVIPLPKGGPGGDAFAPGIAGLDDGRWVLVWTEGSQGNRAIRAQTLDSDLAPLGDPIALSPPAGNFGQGVPGVSGSYLTVVFLSQGKVSFELWGAMLQCG